MRVFLYVAFANIYLSFFGVHAQAEAGDDCQLKFTRSSGQCTLLKRCPGALKEVYEGKRPEVCSFRGKEPIVCCVGKILSSAETPNIPEEKERISRKKCKEYGESVFEDQHVPSLIHGTEPIKVNKCSASMTSLIVGGRYARPKEFPHMALLGFGPQNEIKWQCAGTLISEQFILTAAHCLSSPVDGVVSWIHLGDFNIATDDDDAQLQEFSVMERMRHPGYKPPSIYHDIALLKMDRAVPFTQYIRPACLYTGVPALQDNQRFFATGWNLFWNLEGSGEMLKVVLDSYSNSECNASYTNNINRKLKFGILPDSQICAGIRTGAKDDCQGDSGGPLQIFSDVECMFDIVGVTSFGKSCGFAGSIPGVYSRVSHYLDWIEETVWP